MPQLNETIAAKVDEGGGTSALEDGIYVVELVEVEARPGKVAPYWCWIFDVADEVNGERQKGAGRRLWHNTSLSDQSLWKMAEAFEAFGVPANTNTDDLIGQRVKALVSQKIIEQGKRMGTMGNNVESLMSLATATVDSAAPAAGWEEGFAKAKAEASATGAPFDEPTF